MEKLRQNFSKIKVPCSTNKVYKDECMYSFDNPDCADGLYICLNTFLGFGEQYVRDYSRKSSNFVFLHKKRTRKEIVSDKDAEPDKKIARLAIGVDGGFDPHAGSKKFEYSTALTIVIFPEEEKISYPNDDLPELVKQSISGIENAEGALQKYCSEVDNAGSWDGEIRMNSKYAETLVQLDNGVKVPPKGWKCSKCELTENLWMNLSDGTILCGRKQLDGSGGNNHALMHYDETQFPLAVKLGTITPDGKADVYSYKEDDMVLDPLLVKHLEHFGININQMEKTDKTMAELEIQVNQRGWEYSRLTESGQKLIPMFGPGFTGFENLGNSCYMNSVLQVLFTVPAFINKYFNSNILESMDPSNIPQDLDAQLSKLANGILSGKYSKVPENYIENSEVDIDSLQPGVAPALLRTLVGRGHVDFSTKKQQDVVQYLQHLLELIQRTSHQNKSVDPGQCFRFEVEDKFTCSVTNQVKYVKRGAGDSYLGLIVPLEATTNSAEVEEYNKRKEACTARGEPLPQDAVRAKIPFDAILSLFLAPETINAHSSAAKAQVDMTKSTRLLTFPDYLFMQIAKFGQTETWEAVKYDVSVEMPQFLDLSALASQGPQPGEIIMEETDEEMQEAMIVNDEMALQISSMGFDLEGCKKAVHFTKGESLEEAVNWVMTHASDPDFSVPLVLGNKPQQACSSDFTPNEDHMMMLQAMGFTPPQAKLALKETSNVLERAADWLFSHQPILDELVAKAESGDCSGQSSSPQQQPFTNGSPKYELVGFISHMGTSIHVGHYVCHIKKDGQWIIFNDNKVSKSVDPPIDLGYLYLYKRS